MYATQRASSLVTAADGAVAAAKNEVLVCADIAKPTFSIAEDKRMSRGRAQVALAR